MNLFIFFPILLFVVRYKRIQLKSHMLSPTHQIEYNTGQITVSLHMKNTHQNRFYLIQLNLRAVISHLPQSAIFKDFTINHLEYCECFFFFLASPQSIWDLNSQPEIELLPPALEDRVLTTGLLRSRIFYFFKISVWLSIGSTFLGRQVTIFLPCSINLCCSIMNSVTPQPFREQQCWGGDIKTHPQKRFGKQEMVIIPTLNTYSTWYSSRVTHSVNWGGGRC